MSVFSKKSNETILVADVGGTNARLAVAHLVSEQTASAPELAPTLSDFKSFPCADFHTLEDVLALYLADLKVATPPNACLAVAGPISGDTAHLTNLGWHPQSQTIATRFGFNAVDLVNDFAALARSTTVLGTEDLLELRRGDPAKGGPVSVMGPGTGFGLALLVPHKNGCSIVSGEGGHIGLVPCGDLETQVWTALQKNMGRVTVETLLSGVGLMRIYRELCHLKKISPLNYDPRTISYQALDNGDEICLQTLDLFCSILGSVVGDIVLSQGATGGVFLGGGILPKISEFLVRSKFVERFLDKPPMQDFVAKAPVHLITAPDAALKGAALLFKER